MVPLDRVGAIKILKKEGFIHTDKEVVEKVFGEDAIVKQLVLVRDMYFNKKKMSKD